MDRAKFEAIREQFRSEAKELMDSSAIYELRKKYLDRKGGLVNGLMKEMKSIPAEEKAEYSTVIAQRAVTLSDFDSTVVDPMPEADRTYSQMEEDEQLKLDAFAKQIEGEDEAENAESSS